MALLIRSTSAESAAASSATEENSDSEMESLFQRFQLQQDLIEERRARERRFTIELREKMKDAAFEPETFGDLACTLELSALPSRSSVVSVALFSEEVLVYACSGTAVRLEHDNIEDHHTIFVTSARLAQKFNDNRTRDDNLRIRVRTSDGRILHGFLGVYDEKNGIAIVTSFSPNFVYTLDTCEPVNPGHQPPDDNLFAFGRATDGTLMGVHCFRPVFLKKDLASVSCKITESGHGGPVLYFDRDGIQHIAGLTVTSGEGMMTFLKTEKLHSWLKRVLRITSNTSHFQGYSLPKGLKTVIPSGFMSESMYLESLGYPLPPPLLFELNGELAGRYEEHFGQLHYWEGYPFDNTYDYGRKPIWNQLGERLTQKISQSVVSIASFKDNKRCFACTGLLIAGKDYPLVLTSASLVRTGDAEGEIDEKLTIEVFLPRNHTVQGILELYHKNYNIAIVRLKDDFTADICPQDILNVRRSKYYKSAAATGLDKRRAVVAIGRATKECFGLLMASMGKVKGNYEAVTEPKNKRSTGLAEKPDCQELLVSTCQIKKVGIGGPLIGLDGSFIGMNFYDETRTTPFLPRQEILTVLREWFALLESSVISRPFNMDLCSKTRKRKRNRWPVSKPYWFFPGQVDPLD